MTQWGATWLCIFLNGDTKSSYLWSRPKTLSFGEAQRCRKTHEAYERAATLVQKDRDAMDMLEFPGHFVFSCLEPFQKQLFTWKIIYEPRFLPANKSFFLAQSPEIHRWLAASKVPVNS